MIDGDTPLLWQLALAVVQVDEEQGQRGEALLAVNDVALAFFLAEDDRAEKVVAIFDDCITVMVGFVVFQKFPTQVVNEFNELFGLPLVFALVGVNGVAAVEEQFAERAALMHLSIRTSICSFLSAYSRRKSSTSEKPPRL